MKDRLITLLGAALAFFVMVILLNPQSEPEEEPVSLPTSEDTGKYGLKTAYRWFSESGLHVMSLRERYTALTTEAHLPTEGNLLVISLPLRTQTRHWETQQLQTWVEQGNHILFLTAMSDWPEWAIRYNYWSINELLGLFDYRITDQTPQETADEEEDDEDTSDDGEKKEPKKPEHIARKLRPAFNHPVTEGISSISAEWLTSEGLNWRVRGDDASRNTLILLRDRADGGASLWQARAGNGSLWVSRFSDLFSNQRLADAQNARLLRNIALYTTQGNGYVIFDDMHQGLSSLYNPEAFFSDPRLHHTLYFLLVLWLVYVMGHSNRFLPVRERLRPPRLIEQVHILGNFFARRLKSSAVAQRLFMHFFNEVRGYYALPLNGQPVWAELTARSNLPNKLLQRAQRLHTRAHAGKQINLVTLSRTIRQIREQLS